MNNMYNQFCSIFEMLRNDDTFDTVIVVQCTMYIQPLFNLAYRCFKGVKALPVDYTLYKNAWITQVIFNGLLTNKLEKILFLMHGSRY